MMKKFLLVSLSLSFNYLLAQLNPIGTWTDHLPYQSGTSMATDGELVYCGTKTGLFTYNSKDNSIETFSKVNLLNDVNISQIAYSRETKSLIIVYANSNIDIVSNNRTTNLPFLKNSTQAQKTINEIKIDGSTAYLAFGFGILLVDLEKKEISNTYKFGENGNAINVNSTEIVGEFIYAATNSGLYKANFDNNLLDFNSWSKEPYKPNKKIFKLFENNYLNIVVDEEGDSDSTFSIINSSLVAVPAASGYSYQYFSKTDKNDFIYYGDNDIKFLDSNSNLISEFSRNSNNVVGSERTDNGRYFVLNTFNPLLEYRLTDYVLTLDVKPNGPFEKSIFDIEASENFVWGVGGRYDGAYNNGFIGGRIYQFDKKKWTSYTDIFEPSLKGITDIVSVNIDPFDEKRVYFGSWGGGLVHFNKSLPFTVFDTSNSSLNDRKALNNWVGAGECDFDEDGNMWIANTFTTSSLSVRKKNGSWKSFDLTDRLKGPETAVYDILADNNGFKWLALEKDNQIVVYNDNGTIDNESDDESILLTSETGKGKIPGARGLILEQDRDGAIWLGTSDGIAVNFNPSSLFQTNADVDFKRVIVFDGENNEIVLENANVTAMAIDGSNQKWIGTDNSGVLLLSEDAKETILEFNVDNSPLFSNSINAIAIDDFTGEVYIATAEGLLSYRGNSTKGFDNFSDVTVFPNPVRPEYSGNITIQGLLDRSTVKITDINGTLVSELKSTGGTAIWNGNNFDGKRASTGVYLIFMSGEDEDGDLKTEVGKIMFIN